MDRIQLARMIDHTLLKPEAMERDIRRLCAEASEFGFCTVCVNPYWVSTAKSATAGTSAKVCGVAGFPLGANTSFTKAREAERIVRDGGGEVDMVINLGRLLERNYGAVEADLAEVRSAIGREIVLKVILECALLTEDLKRDAALLAVNAGADFVKTSTGFHPAGGATAADVALLHSSVKGKARVKASGGIRNLATALEMIRAGAERLGTSSSIAIVRELP